MVSIKFHRKVNVSVITSYSFGDDEKKASKHLQTSSNMFSFRDPEIDKKYDFVIKHNYDNVTFYQIEFFGWILLEIFKSSIQMAHHHNITSSQQHVTALCPYALIDHPSNLGRH